MVYSRKAMLWPAWSPLWCYSPATIEVGAIPLLRSKTVLFPCCVQACRTITVVYQIKRFQQCCFPATPIATIEVSAIPLLRSKTEKSAFRFSGR